MKNFSWYWRGALLWLGIFLPASFLAKWADLHFRVAHVFLGPSENAQCYPLGCEAFGRNIFLLTLQSAGNSLFIGVFSVILLTTVSFAGVFTTFYLGECFGAKAKNAVVGGFEFLQVFPGLIISLSLAATLGPGWVTLCLSLVLNGVPGLYRFLFLQVQPILRKPYIEASRSMGAGPWFLFKRHLLPEIIAAWKWKFPSLVAQSLLLEATLSFLGIGAVLGSNTWGTLLSQAKDYLMEYPILALASGLPLMLTVLSLLIISEPKLWKTKVSLRIRAPLKKTLLKT